MEITDGKQGNPVEFYSFREPEVEKPKQTVHCMVFNAEGKVLLLKKKVRWEPLNFPAEELSMWGMTNRMMTGN